MNESAISESSFKIPWTFGQMQFDKIFKYDLWCKSLIAQQAFVQ